MTTTDPTIENAAARLAALTGQAADIATEIKTLQAFILGHTQPGDTITVAGRAAWTVRPGRRTFDEQLARAVLPAATLEACTVPRIDPGAVKHISPALWEASCRVGQPYLQASRG